MGVSLGIDLSKLDVCFGGFSPTVMGDAIASVQHARDSEERIRARFEAKQHAIQLEHSRESEPFEFTDSNGNCWKYVEMDCSEVRIQACNPVGVDIDVPEKIGELPVVAISAHSFAGCAEIESIRFPDTVVSVGGCAFQDCKKLETIVFSDNLTDFNPNWFRGCVSIHSMVLPGCLEVVPSAVFSLSKLRRLKIGSGTQGVAAGAFEKSTLEVIEVSETNPFISTDGTAIYSKDGSIMVALARPVDKYNVSEGCKAIAKKAFSNMDSVCEVVYPETLDTIGPFALSWTSITEFIAPPNLKSIGEKAFFNCGCLANVHLNSGLEEVGSNAFSNTSIRELTLPSTVERLGFPLVSKTQLIFAGENATFKLEPGSKRLLLDEDGALYKTGANGLFLINLADPDCKSYSVRPGTVRIEPFAFWGHPSIECVELPDSVTKIGESAFRNCRNLRNINLNDGLEAIDDEAFLDTALEEIHIPESVVHIGNMSFITHSAHRGNMRPSLREVAVHENNPRFYSKNGMLLERKNERTSRVVLFAGAYAFGDSSDKTESFNTAYVSRYSELLSESIDDSMDIHIPDEVDEIAPYAFNGARGIRSLWLSDKISTIGIRGLAIESPVKNIHIDLMRPVEGYDSLDISFPDTDRGHQQMYLALTASHFVNPEAIFSHYDTSITNASSFDAQNDKRLDLYEQAVRLIDRLLNPIYLRHSNKTMCERILSNGIEQICVEMAKHNDRQSIDLLVEMGFLNQDNILDVIERVGAVQDASITGYLLEISRRQAGVDAVDFEL